MTESALIRIRHRSGDCITRSSDDTCPALNCGVRRRPDRSLPAGTAKRHRGAGERLQASEQQPDHQQQHDRSVKATGRVEIVVSVDRHRPTTLGSKRRCGERLGQSPLPARQRRPAARAARSTTAGAQLHHDVWTRSDLTGHKNILQQSVTGRSSEQGSRMSGSRVQIGWVRSHPKIWWRRLLCRHLVFHCWREGRHYHYCCTDCGAEWRRSWWM